MPTKITVIYDNPKDPAAFEARYPAHLEYARALPSVTRVETAKVWPKEDGSETPAYRLLDLYFDDYDTASKAVTSDAAAKFVGDVRELATGGVRITFAEVEQG